ncbi:hypothetical protein CPB84DRAFT_1752549 [Gymnopilus junonius]|uniref:Uncharacterized protein n=1 Tax=Gymnopilus junonius TaxID=109634 RepID=A0A9P5NAS3_GYMJU|nr:hypothetical protein CPB84DRAFT_1752549 [Gymnopilus junonius]
MSLHSHSFITVFMFISSPALHWTFDVTQVNSEMVHPAPGTLDDHEVNFSNWSAFVQQGVRLRATIWCFEVVSVKGLTSSSLQGHGTLEECPQGFCHPFHMALLTFGRMVQATRASTAPLVIVATCKEDLTGNWL